MYAPILDIAAEYNPTIQLKILIGRLGREDAALNISSGKQIQNWKEIWAGPAFWKDSGNTH